MSERRTLLSRPRTKVYDCNYNIGEKYYKPMVDKLDRKYNPFAGSGAAGNASPSFSSTIGRSANRDDGDYTSPSSQRVFGRSFDLESLPERRSRMNGVLGEAKSAEEDLEEDIINSMKKLKVLRATRAASVDDDFTSSALNGTASSSSNGYLRQKKLNFSNKILDSVGINAANGNGNRAYDDLEEEILKRRTVKIPSLFDEEVNGSGGNFTKWSKIRESSSTASDLASSELAAMARARQSRARLADIENEIDAVNERGAAREKRMNNIKALLASGGEDYYPDAVQTYRSKKISSNKTSATKKVSF